MLLVIAKESQLSITAALLESKCRHVLAGHGEHQSELSLFGLDLSETPVQRTSRPLRVNSVGNLITADSMVHSKRSSCLSRLNPL